MPIWATDDMNKVTKYLVDKDKNISKSVWFDDAISGNIISTCLQPCKSTKITTVLVDKKDELRNQSKIDIIFSNTVKQSVNDFPEFNFGQFLSSLGGSMGLWLGLGVVQSLEIWVKILLRIFCRNINCLFQRNQELTI